MYDLPNPTDEVTEFFKQTASSIFCESMREKSWEKFL